VVSAMAWKITVGVHAAEGKYCLRCDIGVSRLGRDGSVVGRRGT
jgi:hypothetical protein